MAVKKVLIVEDEKLLREVYALMLQKEGYEVIVAENGEVGIEMLKRHSPDLILLDMLMPVLDGMGFLASANLPNNYPATKTIMISNLSNPISSQDCQKYGVVESILKVDFAPQEFVAIVKKHCPL